eukprot:NODE_1969_length_685_cov_75.103943_g1919_i0.p1 GENE.NODE_1969_length_685_cov_75.103943_g1919_i0~~NODE_1969_length_685_cov_75.103943_g1919_i0.p1  ORF type:complete len:156 (-),score=19.76 NODE_1969_length_685_cov_75.103943_g1919_i0:143-610(-)
MPDIQSIFDSYANFGAGKGAAGHKPEIDNSKFAKLTRECKWVDKKFTSTDIDLIWTKVCPKGHRKIDYDTFITKAVPMIAERKGVSADDLLSKLHGPDSSGTKAQANKFHDDKSMYTGVHQHGGPSTVDGDKPTLASMVSDHDATTCDVRGVVRH